VLLLSVSACISVRRYSPVTPPIRLTSRLGVQLLQPGAEGAPPTVACAVVQVNALIREIRGDTLVLSSVSGVRQLALATPCPTLEVALVVSTNHPDLRANTARFDPLRAVMSILFVKPFVVVGAVALFVFAWLVAS